MFAIFCLLAIALLVVLFASTIATTAKIIVAGVILLLIVFWPITESQKHQQKGSSKC